MHVLQIILFFAPLVIFVIVMIWLQYVHANELLHRWAASAGVQILSAQRRYLRTGPFFLIHGRGEQVFRVTVKHADGMTRQGWICVGWLLADIDKTVVIWDSRQSGH